MNLILQVIMSLNLVMHSKLVQLKKQTLIGIKHEIDTQLYVLW